MTTIRMVFVILGVFFLSACTTTGQTVAPATVAATEKIAQTTSPVVHVSSPYDAAKACIAETPGIEQLNIAIGPIGDKTGKVNMAEGGTGSLVSQGMTDAFFNSLHGLGVSVTDMTPEQQADVTFIAAAGVKGSMRTPSLIIRGSVTSLDLAQQSSVGELAAYSFGPKARAYNATSGMDLRLVTLPGGQLPSNIAVVVSSPFKQFLAVEREVGFASFLGGGSALTYGSFRIGNSLREPMQHTMRFMADYSVGDLVLKYLSKYGTVAQKAAIPRCRALLEWSPTPRQGATAA